MGWGGGGGEDGNEISVCSLFLQNPNFQISFFFFFGGERHKKKAKIIIILPICLKEMGYRALNEGDLKSVKCQVLNHS